MPESRLGVGPTDVADVPRGVSRAHRARIDGPPAPGVNPADFLQPLMTVEDVAKLLKLKPSTVRAYAERGSLPCACLGNRLRFRPSDVGLWIARRFEKGGA